MMPLSVHSTTIDNIVSFAENKRWVYDVVGCFETTIDNVVLSAGNG